MSLLPKRSLRLTGQPTDYYQRFTGASGEIYYDKTLQTLRIFPGNVSVGKVVAAFELGGRLPLGTGAGAIYADQTTGMITIGDYIGTSGQPQAPSTVIKVGGAANAFQISAYGPPARVWTFARTGALILPSEGNLTFPDATVQSTAWTGVADYRNLTNKPDIPELYSFSVAADDSTQRVVSTDEVVKFIGASGITTASDAEGNITITGTIPSSLVNGANTVSLGANGDLTFPSGTLSIENNMFDIITSTNVLSLQGNSIVLSGGLDNGLFATLSQINLSTNGNVVVNSDGEYWYFTPDGDLQIPGNVKSNGNINIEINLSDSTKRIWQFGEDGQLTFPDGTNQATAFTGSVETFSTPTITANAATLNFNSSAIFALGSNAANITANFTNIPGVAGQTISTTLIITQGATAYIPSAVTINGGGSVTPKWQGGTAPSGVANHVNIVSFTFICTATDTWTVLAALTDYN